MKKLFTAAVLFCSFFAAAELLPPAQTGDGGTLRQALLNRQSCRKFRNDALSRQQLANLLWSANGVNRSNGKRTAPSAMDRREVMIFVALPDGGYFYDPAKHLLEKICDTDLRQYCGRFAAPCYLILVPDRSKQSNEVFAGIDTGYVSQNIYLAAWDNGLGTCAMGSIVNRAKLIEELKLGQNSPLLVHPVGIPE